MIKTIVSIIFFIIGATLLKNDTANFIGGLFILSSLVGFILAIVDTDKGRKKKEEEEEEEKKKREEAIKTAEIVAKNENKEMERLIMESSKRASDEIRREKIERDKKIEQIRIEQIRIEQVRIEKEAIEKKEKEVAEKEIFKSTRRKLDKIELKMLKL